MDVTTYVNTYSYDAICHRGQKKSSLPTTAANTVVNSFYFLPQPVGSSWAGLVLSTFVQLGGWVLFFWISSVLPQRSTGNLKYYLFGGAQEKENQYTTSLQPSLNDLLTVASDLRTFGSQWPNCTSNSAHIISTKMKLFTILKPQFTAVISGMIEFQHVYVLPLMGHHK